MQTKAFDPRDWYWQADDGRVFASARAQIITPDDAALKAWSADGTKPAVWARDLTGAQTNASLDAVLHAYGLSGPDGAPSVPLTFLGFLALFTQSEQVAIVSSTDPGVRLFCLMAAGAAQIDLTDPRTIAGTNELESLKLIGSGRAAKVLSGVAPGA